MEKKERKKKKKKKNLRIMTWDVVLGENSGFSLSQKCPWWDNINLGWGGLRDGLWKRGQNEAPRTGIYKKHMFLLKKNKEKNQSAVFRNHIFFFFFANLRP